MVDHATMRRLVAVALECAAAEAADAETGALSIEVAPDGSVIWAGEPLADAAALQVRLDALARDPPQTAIILSFRPDCPIASDLAGRLRKAGVKHIGLVGNEQHDP